MQRQKQNPLTNFSYLKWMRNTRPKQSKAKKDKMQNKFPRKEKKSDLQKIKISLSKFKADLNFNQNNKENT